MSGSGANRAGAKGRSERESFFPAGGVLETDLELSRATVGMFVNGIRKQPGSVSKMILPVDAIIRPITEVMTLEPGDVMATGTPAEAGPLGPDDALEVSVGGMETLRNSVIGLED
jgi:2-keto-4-pentenoate hydratase/2-oxohepta-3-ene-1,7-dioic acid hydratase in catechol pathway